MTAIALDLARLLLIWRAAALALCGSYGLVMVPASVASWETKR